MNKMGISRMSSITRCVLLFTAFVSAVSDDMQDRMAFCTAVCGGAPPSMDSSLNIAPFSSLEQARRRRDALPGPGRLPSVLPGLPPLPPYLPKCPPPMANPQWSSWGKPVAPPSPSNLHAVIQENVRRFWELQTALQSGAWPPPAEKPYRPPCVPCIDGASTPASEEDISPVPSSAVAPTADEVPETPPVASGAPGVQPNAPGEQPAGETVQGALVPGTPDPGASGTANVAGAAEAPIPDAGVVGVIVENVEESSTATSE